MNLNSLAACAATSLVYALAPHAAPAEQKFTVTPIAERTVETLPEGSLFWRIETFPSLVEAEAAGGATALAAEVDGKAWLLTLGPKDGPTAGGETVAEVGPIEPVSASSYLLRLNQAVAPVGTKTSVHGHPGSEAFFVLSGEVTQGTADGVRVADAGKSLPGGTPDAAMEISSTGTEELRQLAMLVVDATRPFSVPASLDR